MTEARPPVFFAAPAAWEGLRSALLARGHVAEEVYSLLGGRPTYNWFGTWQAMETEYAQLRQVFDLAAPGLIDLAKTAAAVADGGAEGGLALGQTITDLPAALAHAYALRHAVGDVLREKGCRVLVTTCTYDALGRILTAAARDQDVPVVHVAHGCQTSLPEDAWWAATRPGDVLCVPGARDHAWWADCLHAGHPGTPPTITIEPTGHPLWDAYAGTERPRRDRRAGPPTILWACESGANAAQTPALWRSRNYPDVAWSNFLDACTRSPEWQVLLKLRRGEDPALVQRWASEAASHLGEGRVTVSDAPAEQVLAHTEVDVVVCQDSNLGVEALCLGLPVVSLSREGGGLFRHDSEAGVWVVGQRPRARTAPLEQELLRCIKAALVAEPTAADVYREAAHYNRGVDGGATQRVCEVIERVARGAPVAPDTGDVTEGDRRAP